MSFKADGNFRPYQSARTGTLSLANVYQLALSRLASAGSIFAYRSMVEFGFVQEFESGPQYCTRFRTNLGLPEPLAPDFYQEPPSTFSLLSASSRWAIPANQCLDRVAIVVESVYRK